MVTKTFTDIHEGDVAEFKVLVDEALVEAFATFSGDYNPLHTDQAFAAKSPMGQRVAHGMLGGALFSRLVGMHLPGANALYLSQSLYFRKPIFLGEYVFVTGRVLQKVDAAQVIKLQTIIRDSSGVTCTDGEAVVRIVI